MPKFNVQNINIIDKKDNKHVWIQSFNRESTIFKDENQNSDIKYLIVGTLTPCDGRKPSDYTDGYFYCGNRNNMYSFIDAELHTLKIHYRQKWDKQDKEKIKEKLIEKGIAFLDVIKEGYVVIDSNSDNDIYPFSLDFETFSKIDFTKLTVVANSRNAKEALEFILKRNNQNGVEINLIPQQLIGYRKNYGNLDDLQRAWRDFLNN